MCSITYKHKMTEANEQIGPPSDGCYILRRQKATTGHHPTALIQIFHFCVWSVAAVINVSAATHRQ
jgi:hypothetical protein